MEQTDSDQRGEGGGQWWKEGEGTSQRTHMKEQWTCTMMWGLTVMGCGLGGRVQQVKNCTVIE